MHLSSLYIDGYGPFEDSLISEFAEGLNLVMAEDETSAAALRDFIWSVIFGFEPGKNGKDGLNLLEAPNRGAAGGFLGFDSTDGPVTVARYRRLAPDHDKDAASDDASGRSSRWHRPDADAADFRGGHVGRKEAVARRRDA